jgi:glycosyltransferase involved in cell wall biosynthesis
MGAWIERVARTAPDGFRARRIVFLSHLVRRQGGDVLIDAVAELRNRGADVVADVVGTGPEKEDLQERTRALALDDAVRFHGFVADHRDVERVLASASVAVAPYRPGEGTFTPYADPGKLKAYLAAGLPIVLTDVPPNAGELERDAGAEIVPFDPEALADAIERLLASPEAWRARREAALAYAARFDWPALLDPLLDELGVPPAVAARSDSSARRRR